MPDVKKVKMHLFALRNSHASPNVEQEVVTALSRRPNVGQRIFPLSPERGSACCMDLHTSRSFHVLHVGRFKPGAQEALITTIAQSLEVESVDPAFSTPPQGQEYLQSQVVCLLKGNVAIAIASDGRCFSDLWDFLRKLLSTSSVTITPERILSHDISRAISNGEVVGVRMSGLTSIQQVQNTIDEGNTPAGMFDSTIPETDQMAIPVTMSFRRPRGAGEAFLEAVRRWFRITQTMGQEVSLDHDEFSIVLDTKTKGPIGQDGFTQKKMVSLLSAGPFVTRHSAYEAMVDWTLEMINAEEWPTVEPAEDQE